MAFFISFTTGVVFLLFGFGALFSNPPRLNGIIRSIMIIMGTGFILSSVLTLLGLTE
ncbi:hypothetical protein [Salisediminibacterium beveridgei]|uniref:hypothetical protein n=1 Tax=Salisediminibacterium beveridgei TaxID=632773 RepID=UPI0012EE3B97|nr:hypothetical protein [Salisediminibacterium beveridgei]